MSKKNSSVNLKNGFKDLKDLSSIFFNFRLRLDSLNKKKYLIAVSGGPDSLALASLAKSYSYFKKTKFYYVLIDHNLRKDSHQEANKVKNLLKKRQIPLRIFVNKKIIKRNIQAEARNMRYRILLDFCKKNNISTLLTAHNLEDQVETFFIRLSRGSGLKGLSAMKQLSKIDNRVNLYRPLLDVKKKFLIKISKITFGKYFKDPSNTNIKFLRTKVRSLKKPLEKSGIKYEQIFKSIQNLSLSKITLEGYFNKIFKDLIKKENDKILISLSKYNNLNYDTKIALINEAVKRLKKNYYDLRSKKIKILINNLKRINFKRSTLGGCIFYKKNGYLCLKVEKI